MNSERAGVRLGIDVGDARVGVAASDPDALLATPVMTLRRDTNHGSDLRMITRIVQDRACSVVYVGLPLSLSGVETPSTQKARDFAQSLAERLAEHLADVQVRLIDERLSTVSASEKMRAAGVESKNQRDAIDQAAAVEILTHALNMRAAQAAEPGTRVFHSSA